MVNVLVFRRFDYTKALSKLPKRLLVKYLDDVYNVLDNRSWSDDTSNIGEIVVVSGYCDFETVKLLEV